ncbi:MAG: diguanylate cyclase [Myxococcota bacterium]
MSHEADGHYDPKQVLADWVRHFGQTSIGAKSLDAQSLAARTNDWARHLMTGTAPPAGIEVQMGDRCYAELRRELIHYRNEEMELARETEGEMRDMVWSLANRLRGVVTDEQESDQEISRRIHTLAESAKDSDLATLKTLVGAAAEAVTRILEERERRHNETLHELSERISQMRDELSRAREKMVEDSLTGLFNRGAFDGAIERYRNIAYATGLPLSLLVIDIDHFKSINDTHGHQAGDAVLKTFARCVIRSFPRRSDFLARYGGEEFAVLMPDTDGDSARMVAQRFVDTVCRHDFDYNYTTIPVTCSVGISTLATADTIESFIKRADQALYRAKGEGRNRAVSAA